MFIGKGKEYCKIIDVEEKTKPLEERRDLILLKAAKKKKGEKWIKGEEKEEKGGKGRKREGGKEEGKEMYTRMDNLVS